MAHRSRVIWRSLGASLGAMVAEPAFCQDNEAALEIGATYVTDAMANVSGGRDRDFRLMGLLDVAVEFDGSSLGVPGLAGLLNLQYVHGKSLNDVVGDAQVVSNIDAPDGVRPLEAWLSYRFSENGYVKGGLIDLNSEFDVQSVGALFLNSSHGIGPDFSQTGLNGPSIFPTTSTAVVVGWNARGWSARAGAFDAVAGDPDRPGRTVVRFPGDSGLLLVAEADVAIAADAQVQVGGWSYTSRFDPIDAGPPRRGNRGAYMMVEGRLAPALDGWVRVGVAEEEINPIGTYIGGGLTFGDDQGKVGLAVAHARLGAPSRAPGAAADRAETIFELTYAAQIHERVRVQPDIQYVINPGWDPQLRNALVVGARVEVSLF